MDNKKIKEFLTQALKEFLTQTRDLISDPKNWTQNTFARNKYGDPVPFFYKSAVCFCSIGALKRVCNYEIMNDFEYFYNHSYDLLNKIVVEITKDPSQTIGHYNDSHTHNEVIAVFNKAINSL